MSRLDTRVRALNGLDLSGKIGVEIGPLNRPIVTRTLYNVLYADHCSTAELRRRYENDANVNVDNIVEIDFDLTKGTLSDQINHSLDYVVASHVIEHIPDMIGWLKEMRSLLNPGGIIALVIPDKRFTFDLHRRTTPFWRLRQAFDEKLKRPSLPMVIEHFLSISPVDTERLWLDYGSAKESAFVDKDFFSWDPSGLVEIWKAGHYIDTHCLVTTPWHFLETMGQVTSECDVDLDLQWIEATEPGSLEFYIQLCRPKDGVRRTKWFDEAKTVKSLASRPEIFA